MAYAEFLEEAVGRDAASAASDSSSARCTAAGGTRRLLRQPFHQLQTPQELRSPRSSSPLSGVGTVMKTVGRAAYRAEPAPAPAHS